MSAPFPHHQQQQQQFHHQQPRYATPHQHHQHSMHHQQQHHHAAAASPLLQHHQFGLIPHHQMATPLSVYGQPPMAQQQQPQQQLDPRFQGGFQATAVASPHMIQHHHAHAIAATPVYHHHNHQYAVAQFAAPQAAFAHHQHAYHNNYQHHQQQQRGQPYGRGAAASLSSNVIVAGLLQEMGEDELRQLFMRFGEILSACVKIDLHTGRSRGFGFVRFATPDAAQQAVLEMNRFRLGPNVLNVELSVHDGHVPEQPSIFVRMWPESATDEETRRFFGRFGHILATRHTADREGDEALERRGHRSNNVTITYTKTAEAKAAVAALQGTFIEMGDDGLVREVSGPRAASGVGSNATTSPVGPLAEQTLAEHPNAFPLLVKFAESATMRKGRQIHRDQQIHHQGAFPQLAHHHHHQLFALPPPTTTITYAPPPPAMHHHHHHHMSAFVMPQGMPGMLVQTHHQHHGGASLVQLVPSAPTPTGTSPGGVSSAVAASSSATLAVPVGISGFTPTSAPTATSGNTSPGGILPVQILGGNAPLSHHPHAMPLSTSGGSNDAPPPPTTLQLLSPTMAGGGDESSGAAMNLAAIGEPLLMPPKQVADM